MTEFYRATKHASVPRDTGKRELEQISDKIEQGFKKHCGSENI